MAQFKGKVLICLSGVDYITLKSGRKQKTGCFLKELTQPLGKLLAAGYSVEFANPNGSAPALDPMSLSGVWFLPWVGELAVQQKLLAQVAESTNFKAPRRFADISDKELVSGMYAGVFLPGGHAPLEDLKANADLGRILLHFHKAQRPTAIICHAPIALLSAQMAAPGKPWAYTGYKLTVYSNTEEMLNDLMWWDTVPKAETALRKAGAAVRVSWPLFPHIIRDRELITGQGPTSALALGDALVAALKAAPPAAVVH
ncbi:hypothetical protein WJX81_002916 [Elliptochloris bilobata]|uniref:DJ-1/PfpI domain-containing protein n=1 Tax=Elliptochloris bilobata TaxID=381761 RepID=A0AAW1RF91_9CHLO